MGEILPDTEDNRAAQTTINQLGLNIKKLQALRREVIAPFLEPALSVDLITSASVLYPFRWRLNMTDIDSPALNLLRQGLDMNMVFINKS